MTQPREVPPPVPEGVEVPAQKLPRGSIVRATLWTLGGEGAAHALRIVSSLVLTRLLDPAAFGIMAVVQVFSQGLNMFSDLGIRPIIIRHERGDDPAFLNTIWTVRLIRGGILAVAFCALAWPVSKFYGQGLLGLILPVASLNLLLEGLVSTKIFSHERHLSRARPTMITLASSIVGIAFMIVGAWIYRSVWVLVWGGVVATLTRAFLSHVALPGPSNRFHWDRSAWSEVAHFGKWVFLNSVVTFLAMQMDKLIFAKMIPLWELGIFAIAVNIVLLPTTAVRAIGTMVAFPSFSRARNQQGDLPSIFDRMRLLILIGGGAGISFLVLNGPWLITLLYDPRYETAGWMLQVIAIGGWFIVLETAPGLMLMTLGQPRWLTAASALKILAWAVAVPLGFHLYKFPGALAAASLVEGVRYAVASLRVHKSGMTGWKHEGAASGLVLGCGGAAALIQYAPWFSGGFVLKGVLSFAAFAAVWAPIGLWYLGKVRRTA